MSCPHPEKVAHGSFNAALRARDSLETERGIDLGLRPYRCECGAWHLGHQDSVKYSNSRIRSEMKAGRARSSLARRRRTR